MAHVRSMESLQRRKARQFVIQTAYLDRVNGDVVSQVETRDVSNYLVECFGDGVCWNIQDMLKGEVVADPRGQGTFQK